MSFPALSSPAFSIPAVWCRIFRSRIFRSRVFSVPLVPSAIASAPAALRFFRTIFMSVAPPQAAIRTVNHHCLLRQRQHTIGCRRESGLPDSSEWWTSLRPTLRHLTRCSHSRTLAADISRRLKKGSPTSRRHWSATDVADTKKRSATLVQAARARAAPSTVSSSLLQFQKAPVQN